MPHVNGERLNGWLAQFDAIGRTASGINRPAYSKADLAGQAFTRNLLREAGLSPSTDAAGNIMATLQGQDASLPCLMIGSHVDSVANGGNFDGPLGTFAAIEIVRTLNDAGLTLRHPLEVAVWSNEEGGIIGSKLAVGAFDAVNLDSVAHSGITIREGIGIVGGNALGHRSHGPDAWSR